MGWLVSFLKSWYEPQEITNELGRWHAKFRESMTSGNPEAARNALEYRRWLAEAEDDPRREEAIKELVRDATILNDPRVFEELDLSYNLSSREIDEIAVVRNLLVKISENLDRDTLEKRYKIISESDMDSQVFWNVVGLIYADAHLYEKAVSSYDHALQIDPEYSYAHDNREISLRNLRRYDDTVLRYDRSLALNPNDAVAWHNRGNSLADLGRDEDAVFSYNHALSLDPRNASAWYNRGVSLINLNRFNEAIESYKRSIEETKENDASSWRPYLGIINASLFSNKGLEIVDIWDDFLELINIPDAAYDMTSSVLIDLIDKKHLSLVRQLLAFPAAQERFFPLVRALAYHDTCDQDLLEKLAPEMLPIVEEVVAKLDQVDPPANPKAKS